MRSQFAADHFVLGENQKPSFCFYHTMILARFARALSAQHPATRSDRSTGVCRENSERKK